MESPTGFSNTTAHDGRGYRSLPRRKGSTQIARPRRRGMPFKTMTSGSDPGAARAYAELKAAKTPEDAAVAWTHFERPAGYRPEQPGASQDMGDRVLNARAAYRALGGQSTPQLVDMRTGQPAPANMPARLTDPRMAIGQAARADILGLPHVGALIQHFAQQGAVYTGQDGRLYVDENVLQRQRQAESLGAGCGKNIAENEAIPIAAAHAKAVKEAEVGPALQEASAKAIIDVNKALQTRIHVGPEQTLVIPGRLGATGATAPPEAGGKQPGVLMQGMNPLTREMTAEADKTAQQQLTRLQDIALGSRGDIATARMIQDLMPRVRMGWGLTGCRKAPASYPHSGRRRTR